MSYNRPGPGSGPIRRSRQRQAEERAESDAYAGFTARRQEAVERALPSVSVVSLPRVLRAPGLTNRVIQGEESSQSPAFVYEGLIEALSRSHVPLEHLAGLEGGITVHRGRNKGNPQKSGRYQPEWVRGGDVPASRPAGIEVWLSGRNYQHSPAQQRSLVHEVGHHATIDAIEVSHAKFNEAKDLYERGASEALADNYASLRFVPQQGAGPAPSSYYQKIVEQGQAHPDFSVSYQAERDEAVQRAPIGAMDAPEMYPFVAGRRTRAERVRSTNRAGQPRPSRRSRSKKK